MSDDTMKILSFDKKDEKEINLQIAYTDGGIETITCSWFGTGDEYATLLLFFKKGEDTPILIVPVERIKYIRRTDE